MNQTSNARNLIIEDAERMVLATAIHSAKASFEVMSRLKADDFSLQSHQMIYDVLMRQQIEGSETSVTKIAHELLKEKKLDRVGGIEYLTQISGYFYTDEGIEEFIDIVFKNSIGRQLDFALNYIKDLRNQEIPVEDIFSEAQSRILDIKTDSNHDDIVPISKTIQEVVEKIHLLEQQGDVLTGVTTGFDKLDKITNGLQAGDFIILAARPSMGKTALALNLAYNAAQNHHGVAFFSLEMPKEQLVQRILGSTTKIESSKIRSGTGLTNESWKAITAAADKIKKMNIVIDDSPGINILQIQAKLRKMKRDHNISICVIDYLQLISTIGNGDNRQNEIATISRQLKKIAREVGVPIVCLSQLSRSVEKREDRTPIMSDLRDSGAIEQDADVIMFLYREAYYEKKSGYDEVLDNTEETDLIISKHRNGATGIVKLNFHKSYGKFTDI
ncbi:replicative DNA helicase [Spiroplasma sabaudiense Ar-1343]|uniref:Replicative DNA helicase n=1 Tax=Spiroplasma sabaudiense Ar-1343 TaxID=1276257 RepID=W6A8E6_9MOLU|nr:replicative DNA helicase [Spiroplasma sabaudiense]AHI53438.1 replicative DNA helicase [Spiroplasma sabaudiense Ar-1343]